MSIPGDCRPHAWTNLVHPVTRFTAAFVGLWFSALTLAQDPVHLTTIASVKRLSADMAAQHPPVRLQGTITALGSAGIDFFLQDDTGGVYVQPTSGVDPSLLRVGERIAVEGYGDPGGYSPMVYAQQIVSLGRDALPSPKPATALSLAHGRFDAERVALEGVVQGVQVEGDSLNLTVMADDLVLVNFLKPNLASLPPRLRGARVRLTGIAAPGYNEFRQSTLARLFVSSADAFDVLRPSPEDPWGLPVTPVTHLLRYAPEAAEDTIARVEGIVTALLSRRTFFLQDESGGVLVRIPQPASVAPGVRLSLLGSPQIENSTVVFRAHELQSLGQTSLPAAQPVTPETIARPEHDQRRVSLEARVLDVGQSLHDARSQLALEFAGISIIARAHHAAGLSVTAPVGSLVRVAGVLDNRTSSERDFQGMSLHLAGPEDLVILAAPPLDPTRHLLLAVALLGGVGLLAAGWIFTLRRRVAYRTAALTQANAALLEEVAQRRRTEAALRQAKADVDDAFRELQAADARLQAAHERSEQLAVQAQAASRAKGAFLATMSHEIRTPMNGILGMTELLQQSRLDPQQREFANSIYASGEALLRILNDILDLSKIEAGRLELAPSDFDLPALVQSVVTLVAQSGAGKPVELRAEFDPSVPRRLHGDDGRLRQVLLNLVSNGLKFTAAGSVIARVRRVAADASDVRLRFEIVDTGEGIPEHKRELLFQPFQQLDTSPSRRHGGTGLGLAISWWLVQMMGGVMGVESTEGQGSTFWFEVTLPPAAGPDPAAPARLPPNLRLLLVQEEALNRRLSLLSLEKIGCHPEIATSGHDALKRFVSEPYDVVLFDLWLPDMDSCALAAALRAQEQSSPAPSRPPARLIALVAGGEVEDPERLRAAGIDATLNSPLTLTTLAAALTGRR